MDEITIPNNRKVTSIFVDPDIWQSFLKKCRTQSQSTCGVLEAFMYAYTKGVPDGPRSPLPIVNVNLTVNRVVSKVRRKSYEKDDYMGDSRNGILYRDGSWEPQHGGGSPR